MNKNQDLIFHVVSRRKFKENYNSGSYFPPEAETAGLVCVPVTELKEFLDREFRTRKNLLILVIDRIRLDSKLSIHSEDGLMIINGPINQDAVIDKIRIDCNPDGLFDISVETK
ncbi:MAG: hypothetical protein EA360_08715 [Balneolaceae bacterium]|nr:MAG: hypothetical protein EA360_08715 [Balneolaceae bacterium]